MSRHRCGINSKPQGGVDTGYRSIRTGLTRIVIVAVPTGWWRVAGGIIAAQVFRSDASIINDISTIQISDHYILHLHQHVGRTAHQIGLQIHIKVVTFAAGFAGGGASRRLRGVALIHIQSADRPQSEDQWSAGIGGLRWHIEGQIRSAASRRCGVTAGGGRRAGVGRPYVANRYSRIAARHLDPAGDVIAPGRIGGVRGKMVDG